MYCKTFASLTIAAFIFSMAHVQAKGPVFTRPAQAKKQNPDFGTQGEYVGTIDVGEKIKIGFQLIALGQGKFQSVAYHGGLPGDGWDGEKIPMAAAERKDDGSITFVSDQGTAIFKDGAITVVVDGSEVGTLKKVTRKSETLNKKPPKGAIVLFDGKSPEQWNNAVMVRKQLAFDPKGPGATTKKKFGSHSLHIEFRLPYMPEAKGQGRGNSGIYLQSRYEVQMLDSFGLEGENNECGGVYTIAKPKVNMCYPPLTWQTYDIDFTAAKYDSNGKMVKNPQMTVKHNGVVIHKDLELPKSTTASPLKPGPEDAPIYLQNHGNPVRYRNIWVMSKS